MAMTTLATLVLELTLTRIFSVVFYYHFAFLAISVALFGLGIGGMLSYVAAARSRNTFRTIGVISLANSAVVVAALAYLLSSGAGMSTLRLGAVYAISALPFLGAGAVISLALAETIERVDKVYFFDLMGAAGGCLALVPLLNVLGGANTVIAAGVLYAAAAGVWFTVGAAIRWRIAAVAVALLLAGLVAFNAKERLFDIRYAKGRELTAERFVKWNSFSRIAIAPEKQGSPTLLIYIDADASTGIPSYDLDNLTEDERRGLLYDLPGIPFLLRPAAKTLVIGPGGGWDIARAIASGSRDVTGVEINPIIANTIMRQRFPDLSRGIYLRPEVRIFVEDARSFIRRSKERYQVIQATLVDTWASTAAGAFSLSENSLYTVEAFVDYLKHLREEGLLAFTRWGFDPPRESLRLVTLADEALRRIGAPEPWRHVIVGRANVRLIEEWGATDLVMISRQPFSAQDIERAKEVLAAAGLDAVYVPGDTEGSAFARFLRAPSRQRFLREYPYNVRPVTDDRPFFFYTVQPRDIIDYVRNASRASADRKINIAVPVLFGLLSISLAATLLLLVLPPLVLGSRLPEEKGVRRFLLYFVCVGAGYILIQVALIQKFVLFLGQPTYALTVIIFSMLISSSAGSYFSRRFGTFELPRLRAVLLMVFALVSALALTLSPLTTAGVGLPFAVRVLMSVLVIVPVGFVMGMPFPSALARLEVWHKQSVRWAWSLNAAASVLGSAAAVFLALYIGLRATLIVGGLLYLGALAALSFAKGEASVREAAP
jgi:predicted membrane-bound spermidine synthase